MTYKAEYFTGRGAPAWVKRSQILQFANLDEKLVGRHKFYHFDRWIHDLLSQQIREYFEDLSESTDGFFGGKIALKRILNEHFQKRRNLTQEIDTILTMALTRKKLLGENCFVKRNRGA
jgi:hypothetical protein